MDSRMNDKVNCMTCLARTGPPFETTGRALKGKSGIIHAEAVAPRPGFVLWSICELNEEGLRTYKRIFDEPNGGWTLA